MEGVITSNKVLIRSLEDEIQRNEGSQPDEFRILKEEHSVLTESVDELKSHIELYEEDLKTVEAALEEKEAELAELQEVVKRYAEIIAHLEGRLAASSIEYIPQLVDIDTGERQHTQTAATPLTQPAPFEQR